MRAERARLSQPLTLTEHEALDLLADYGLPVVPHHVVSTLEAALEGARAMGLPVVLKTAAPGILHTSDVGGLMLDLTDDEAVATAYADLAERLGPQVVVAPMTSPGVELALGVVRDPQFGSIVLVAGGGVFIEVLGDRHLGLVPIDQPIAESMISKLAIKPILDGIRGRPPLNVDAVAAALVALSDLAADLGDLIAELDVNPLAVSTEGALALDALVIPTAVRIPAAAQERP